MSKKEHITEIAEEFKNRLPLVITKEELMNCYIHEIKPRGIILENITVFNLFEAAHLAGKQVKGKSKLEINVSAKEQMYFIRNSSGISDIEGFKKKLNDNKKNIVKAYQSGLSLAEISKAYGCCSTTVGNYLRKFGVTLRPKGWG